METDYLNFLKAFYQEELYLVDPVENNEVRQEKGPPTVAENKVEEPYIELKEEWNFIGEHDASIAFILDESSTEALPENIKERFTTMLSRLHLETKNLLIVNRSGKYDAWVEKKILELKASKVVLLGADNIFNSLQDKKYNPLQHQGKSFLVAPSFSEVLQDKSKVKMLWDGLTKLI